VPVKTFFIMIERDASLIKQLVVKDPYVVETVHPVLAPSINITYVGY